MDERYFFSNNVLNELLYRTRLIKSQLDTKDTGKDKNRKWRCRSCGQLCGWNIHRIKLSNNEKTWDLNVDNL